MMYNIAHIFPGRQVNQANNILEVLSCVLGRFSYPITFGGSTALFADFI